MPFSSQGVSVNLHLIPFNTLRSLLEKNMARKRPSVVQRFQPTTEANDNANANANVATTSSSDNSPAMETDGEAKRIHKNTETSDDSKPFITGASDRLSYRLLGIAQEGGGEPEPGRSPRKSINCVAFSHWCHNKNLFATCGDTQIVLYEADPNLEGGFIPIVSFHTPDECFHSCDWSFRKEAPKAHLLIAAGKSGYIRLTAIKCKGGPPEDGLIGKHMGEVNDVKISRKNPQLLATCSTDYSVRLWSVKSKALIAIFAANAGPRASIVSVSFHDHHSLIIATGINHIIRIWNYGKENVQEAIERASRWELHPHAFLTVNEHIPYWATQDVHSDYVDCVAWYADWVISSSVEEQVVFWQCGREGDDLMKLKCEYEILYGVPEDYDDYEEEISPEKEESSKKKESKPSEAPKKDRNEENKAKEAKPIVSRYRGKYAKPGYLGPDVRIAKRFDIPNSRMYFKRFSLDYEQKLLSIGNCAGELFLFYLGTKKDCEKGFEFRDIKALTIPPHPSMKNRVIRKTAFNYASNLMVAVSDKCYVAIYEVTVHEMPEPQSQPPPEDEANPTE